MSAEDLDRRLTVALAARAERVRAVGDPVAGVAARATRIRRRRRVAVGAPAAATVVVLGAMVAGGLLGPGRSGSLPATGTTTAPATRDEALRQQLAADPAVVKGMLFDGRTAGRTVLCGVNVVGADPTQTHLYVWLGCGLYTTGPDAAEVSAGTTASVVTVTGRGPQVRVVDVAFPRQASLAADISRMFPAGVAAPMLRGNLTVTPDWAGLLERARRTD